MVRAREAVRRPPQSCCRPEEAAVIDITLPRMVELALEADSGACRGPRGERQQICYWQAFPKEPSFSGHHPLNDFPSVY